MLNFLAYPWSTSQCYMVDLVFTICVGENLWEHYHMLFKIKLPNFYLVSLSKQNIDRFKIILFNLIYIQIYLIIDLYSLNVLNSNLNVFVNTIS